MLLRQGIPYAQQAATRAGSELDPGKPWLPGSVERGEHDAKGPVLSALLRCACSPRATRLSVAIAVLRDLVSRAQEANDRSFDDGHSVDAWQSDELGAAIKHVEAVIVKAEAAMAEPPPE